MRLLHEIVRDEIAKAYPIVEQDETALRNEARERRDRTFNRMKEDKALSVLVGLTQRIIEGAAISPLRDDLKRDMYAQIIVDAIIIWENSNNLFNKEIGIQP